MGVADGNPEGVLPGASCFLRCRILGLRGSTTFFCMWSKCVFRALLPSWWSFDISVVGAGMRGQGLSVFQAMSLQ